MATIFSKIIAGEIPSYKVAESDTHLAFLDINPVQIGHTLVVPKKEVDKFFDLSDNDLTELMLFSKQVAAAIEKTIPCDRVGVSVLGLEVPHAHVHLMPLRAVHDMDFSRSRVKLTNEEMQEIASKIAANF